MRFYHTKCGGEIDVKKHRCTKCKKKWNPISFKLDPTGIRPMVDERGRLVPSRVTPEAIRKKGYTPGKRLETEKKSYANWGDKIPGLAVFASRLPRWPRWARILTTVVFVTLVVIVILLIRR